MKFKLGIFFFSSVLAENMYNFREKNTVIQNLLYMRKENCRVLSALVYKVLILFSKYFVTFKKKCFFFLISGGVAGADCQFKLQSHQLSGGHIARYY